MNRDRRYKDIPGMLKDQDVFLLGGGPSLRGFDLSRLDDENVIAINHSIEHYPNAFALIFGDSVFRRKTPFDLDNYKGLIFVSEQACYKENKEPIVRDNIYHYKVRRHEPILNPKLGLYHPTCTGIAAINLALQMRAHKIYLLGYDFYVDHDEKGNESQRHYYPDYKHHDMITGYKLIKKAMKLKPFDIWSHKIINLNPKSKLKMFRFMDVDEVL